MVDTLSKESILKYTKCNLNENNLHLLSTVDSTNQYCKKLIASCPCHELLVVADTQTQGKGRMGRSFFSPVGTGIYMSLILNRKRFSLPTEFLTIAAGTAVCRVLRNYCNIDASIKWVNDIFANNRKVCGILAESVSLPETNLPEHIVVGIGINISTPNAAFPEEIQDVAGSVFPTDITRNEIIGRIANEFRSIYTKESTRVLIEEYKSYSLVLGKEISLTQNGKACIGIATDINDNGNLVVRLNNNETITLHSGEVSLGSTNFI